MYFMNLYSVCAQVSVYVSLSVYVFEKFKLYSYIDAIWFNYDDNQNEHLHEENIPSELIIVTNQPKLI